MGDCSFILLVPEPQNRGDSISVVLNSLRLDILKGMWHDLSYWQHFDLSSASPLPPPSSIPAGRLHCVQGPDLNSSGEHAKRLGPWTYIPSFLFYLDLHPLTLPLFLSLSASCWQHLLYTKPTPYESNPGLPFELGCLHVPRLLKPAIR